MTDKKKYIKNEKCNPTNTDWVVFVLSVLFTILTCDNIFSVPFILSPDYFAFG